MSGVIGGEADGIGGSSRCGRRCFRWASLDDVDRPAISEAQHSNAEARLNIMSMGCYESCNSTSRGFDGDVSEEKFRWRSMIRSLESSS
jgi:hypothetical protein